MLKRGLLGVSLALVNLLTPGSAFFCHDVDGIKIISLGNFLRFPRPPPQLNCCFPVCCRTWVSELKPLAPIHLTAPFYPDSSPAYQIQQLSAAIERLDGDDAVATNLRHCLVVLHCGAQEKWISKCFGILRELWFCISMSLYFIWVLRVSLE